MIRRPHERELIGALISPRIKLSKFRYAERLSAGLERNSEKALIHVARHAAFDDLRYERLVASRGLISKRERAEDLSGHTIVAIVMIGWVGIEARVARYCHSRPHLCHLC